MSKVTDEMIAAGAEALHWIMPDYSRADVKAISVRIYNAMRAARPRKQRKAEQDAQQPKPLVDRGAVGRAMYKAHPIWHGCPTGEEWLTMADAAIDAMGAAMVPEEASYAMQGAGVDAWDTYCDEPKAQMIWHVWRAMLAAWREESK